MDDISYRKLRNIVTIAPKPQITWTELSKGRIVALPDFCGGIGGGVGGHQKVETNMEKIKNLVTDFLYLVSGGDVIQMLGDILCTMEKDKIPGLSGVNDSSGYKRIDKLNEIVRKSPPLKPWPLRENKDSKVRLEIELTARRCLSYLSGGHIVQILIDVLYEDEREKLAGKYKSFLCKLGETIKHFKPKSKALILDVARKSGFSKDDLRESGWIFSYSLWKSAASFSDSHNTSLPLLPSKSFGKKSRHSSRLQSRVIMTTRVKERRKERTTYNQLSSNEDNEDIMIVNMTSGSSNSSSPRKHVYHDLSTSSEDEEEISQRQRLNAKNPMFPQL